MKPSLRLVKGYSMPQEPSLLAAAIERYLSLKRALDPDTQAHYRKVLNLYRTINPDWPPTTGGILRFVVHCQARYEDSTTFAYWTVVKAFAAWLYKRKIISYDPLEDVAPPGKPDELPRAPPTQDLKALFDYLESQVERALTGKKRYPYWGWREVRNLAMLSVMLDTGLRVSEAANILLEDVDLRSWSILVRHTKRKKWRYVAMGRTARADLKLWLRYRELIPMRSDSPGLRFLFVSRYLGWVPMTFFNIGDLLHRICKELEIEPAITPHLLRHGYATYAIERGAKWNDVQNQMGHASITTTARYAKKVDKGRLRSHLESSPRDFLF